MYFKTLFFHKTCWIRRYFSLFKPHGSKGGVIPVCFHLMVKLHSIRMLLHPSYQNGSTFTSRLKECSYN